MAHIVCIDDHQDILDVTKLCLEMIGGFSVTTFHDGQSALALLPDIKADLILLDSIMPGLDGRETFRALREIPALRDTPVIFMTGRGRPAELQQFIDLGAASALAKPFDADELVNTINKVLTACQPATP